MNERRVMVKAFSRCYGKASKKEKGKILDRLAEATEFCRRYAARLLRLHGLRLYLGGVRLESHAQARVRRKRKRVYVREVEVVLKRLWVMMDYVGGKGLAAALPGLVRAPERHGERNVAGEVRAQLERISAAAIDRLLSGERRRLRLKNRARTKPGTLLRHQIPIRTFEDWDEKRPGFVEVDLVAHDGGHSWGDYAQTLNLVDVATGWTESVAVRNKAQVWVFEALQQSRQRLPFPLLGMDSDNGGEFINPHLRRFVGYQHNEGAEAVEGLNELYPVLSLYLNFFMPSLQLKEKIRHGSRLQKRYHPARLRRPERSLNPAELHRRILALRRRLELENETLFRELF